MAINPTVRFVAALSGPIRHRIGSAGGVGGLTPTQSRIPYFIPGRCREQDLSQQGIEEEFNLLIYAVRVLLSLIVLSTMFGVVIMARSPAGRIIGTRVLVLPEGYDTIFMGDHESLVKEMRDGDRAERW